MTAAVAKIGSQYLPRGWRDLGRQLAIWFGFLVVYQVVRGLADRDPTQAFQNGLMVIGWEEHVSDLFEVTLQNFVAGSHFLTVATTWTYWNSEFTVVGLTLLWVYIRRHDHFKKFRNWILSANLIGLLGYVLVPTAPPRMFPTFGFHDLSFRVGAAQPRQRADRVRRQPVRGDAEPPRGRRADRRDHDGDGLPPLVGARALAPLAGLGLVQRHGDRQPLLARLRGRRRGGRCSGAAVATNGVVIASRCPGRALRR